LSSFKEYISRKDKVKVRNVHEQSYLFNSCTVKSKLNVFIIEVPKRVICAKFELVTSLDYYDYLHG